MENKEFVREDHAKVYSVYRRDIPDEVLNIIFNFLKEKVTDFDTALDVGCGSGQSTVVLAPHFKRVIGNDVSEAQIKEAERTRKPSNVQYKHQVAETLNVEDESVQLITASSCLHWFDLDVFFPEARRVLANNGVLATYVYVNLKPFSEDKDRMKKIDELIEILYNNNFGPYWSPKSKIAFNLYRDVEFPFEEVKRMYKIMDIFDGTLSDVLGYMQTLSGFQKLKLEKGEEEANNIIASFKDRMCELLDMSPSDSESAPLKLCREFMMVLCRKKN